MKKWIALMVSVIMLLGLGLLSGCGEDRAKEYGPYVQSVLDVMYKHQFDTYLDLVEDTEDSCQEYYDTNIEYWAYTIAEQYNMVLVNEEVEVRMYELTEKLCAAAKYEVAKAVKSGDYYTVEVKVHPLALNELIADEAESFATEFDAKTGSGDYGDIENDDEAYYAWEATYSNAVMDIIEKKLNAITYEDIITKIVKIEVDEDGMYGISETDQFDVEKEIIH